MALTDQIKFKQGSLNALKNQAVSNGSLWFTTDEGAIYLDVNNSRVRFGDFITVANVAALPTSGHAYESALYYAKEENILARWDKTASKWVQLNAAGLSQIKVNGSGNVLSGATITLDAETGAKVLTFSTASVATSEALEGLQTRVGSLETRMTTAEASIATITGSGAGSIAKAVADAKADLQAKIDAVDELADKGIADAAAASAAAAKVQENLDSTNTRVGSAETAISNLQTAVGQGGSVDSKISDAKAELLGDANSVAGSATISGANKAAAAAQQAADNAQDTADDNAEAIESLTTRVAANEGNITNLQTAVNTLNADDKTAGSVDYKIAQEVAKILNDNDASDIDTLEEIAAWITNDVTGVGSIIKRLSDVESKNDGQDTAITSLQTTVADNKAAAEKAITDLINGAATYKTLKALEDAVIAAKSQADKGVSDAGAAKTYAEGVQSNLDSTNTRVTTAEGTIQNHSTRLSTAETDITNLKAADTAIRSEFAAADNALKAELKGDAATYTTLGKAEDAIQANASSIDGINTQIAAINNILTWETFE